MLSKFGTSNATIALREHQVGSHPRTRFPYPLANPPTPSTKAGVPPPASSLRGGSCGSAPVLLRQLLLVQLTGELPHVPAPKPLLTLPLAQRIGVGRRIATNALVDWLLCILRVSIVNKFPPIPDAHGPAFSLAVDHLVSNDKMKGPKRKPRPDANLDGGRQRAQAKGEQRDEPSVTFRHDGCSVAVDPNRFISHAASAVSNDKMEVRYFHAEGALKPRA